MKRRRKRSKLLTAITRHVFRSSQAGSCDIRCINSVVVVVVVEQGKSQHDIFIQWWSLHNQ